MMGAVANTPSTCFSIAMASRSVRDEAACPPSVTPAGETQAGQIRNVFVPMLRICDSTLSLAADPMASMAIVAATPTPMAPAESRVRTLWTDNDDQAPMRQSDSFINCIVWNRENNWIPLSFITPINFTLYLERGRLNILPSLSGSRWNERALESRVRIPL